MLNKFEGRSLLTIYQNLSLIKRIPIACLNYLSSSNKNPNEHDEDTRINIQKGNFRQILLIIAIDETKNKTSKIEANTFISKVIGVIDEKLKHLINKSSKNSADAKDFDGSASLKPQYQNHKFSEEDWSAEAKNKNPRKRKKDEVDEEDEDYNNFESGSEVEVSFDNKQRQK